MGKTLPAVLIGCSVCLVLPIVFVALFVGACFVRPQPDTAHNSPDAEVPDAAPEPEVVHRAPPIAVESAQPEIETPPTTPAVQEPQPARYATIPGLTAVDVHGNLTNKGFSLEREYYDASMIEGLPYLSGMMWICRDDSPEHTMSVEIDGVGPTEILSVQVTYINYLGEDTNAKAKDFLGYVASVPYEGSDPARARQWVDHNIGRNARTTIGGVTFELFANQSAMRMLMIQPESEATPTTEAVDAAPGAEMVVTEPEPVVDAERRAKQRLDLAKKLLEQDSRAGRRWLEELIEKWPETEAAQEARELLGE